jgi:hypothetical protein
LSHLDWFSVFKKKDDSIPHSPDIIHNCIGVDGILTIEAVAAVPANAVLWNGLAFRPDGTALYTVPE